MAYEIRISVKKLAEFLLQSGSLDNRFGGIDRASEGARIHRRLQKAGGPSYRAEVFLSQQTERHGFLYRVEGRADGVITDAVGVTVDEIKTTGAPLTMITEDFNRAHWGQAMCYAYFYCLQENLERISVQLTYFQVDTEEIRRFQRVYTAEELEAFYLDLLDQYEKWAAIQRDWTSVRDQSIRALAFPFATYRAGQRQMAVAVYRTIAAKGRLFCQAPTGIGKTVSTLFPAVKAMGEGKAERIFYLTAKTVTRRAAEDAFAQMRDQGLRLKTITLTAKDKICFLEQRDCNPEACPYANGYYDRANQALYELVHDCEAVTREAVEACAQKHRVCPFELSLDAALWCDAIIGDYNYLFNPVVYLKRFFGESPGEYVFLVDEAHNLVDRSRDMYSAALHKSTVLQARRLVGKEERKLFRALGAVNTEMLTLRKACGESRTLTQEEAPKELLTALNRFISCWEEWAEEHRHSRTDPLLLQLYFDALFFLRIAELYDDHFVTYVTVSGSDVTVKLLCLDPSPLLDKAMQRGRASIFFSATLSPLDYFTSVLGGDDTTKKYVLPSPFDPAHLGLFIDDRVSTKYRDRARSLHPVAELLYAMLQGRQGNYLAYFPSYSYMNEVYRVFRERYPEVQTLLQTAGMDEEARMEFLNRFDVEPEGTLLGFCVLGGIYAEGIDLRGERLIGTAIVGVGLPQVNAEQEILRAYYDRTNGEGFAFAYQYPGMNKVLQAAGRVIRGEQDRGVVLLIDSRFSTASYRNLFPTHWQHFQTVRSAPELEQAVAAFWEH